MQHKPAEHRIRRASSHWPVRPELAQSCPQFRGKQGLTGRGLQRGVFPSKSDDTLQYQIWRPLMNQPGVYRSGVTDPGFPLVETCLKDGPTLVGSTRLQSVVDLMGPDFR